MWLNKLAKREGTSTTPPGIGTTGDITVIVEENDLTYELIRLACFIARRYGRSVRLLHIIEVPRSLPLSATPIAASEVADRIITRAQAIAAQTGCAARVDIVGARDAAAAIVEEVREQPCALLLIGLVRSHRKDQASKPVHFILGHAPCRVWLIQEGPPI